MSKMLINIPDNITPDNLEDYFGVRSPKLFATFMSGTIISDNITNGDVMKLLFPDITVEKTENGDIWTDIDTDSTFSSVWWDAPYNEDND